MIPARAITRYGPQADLPRVAEIQTRLARCRIKGNEPSVLRGFVNTTMAELVRGPGRVEPSGHTAIDEAVAIVESFIDFGIICPALLASFRIKSDHTIERRGEIESAINENGSGFKATAFSATAAIGNVSSMKDPGDF